MTLSIYTREDDEKPASVAGFWFTSDDLRPVGVRLDQFQGLRASEVQRFAWRQWMTVAEEAARRLLAGQCHVPIPFDELQASPVGRALGADEAQRKRGPKPRDPQETLAFLSNLAREYSDLRAEGSTAPATALARRHHYNVNTMRHYIYRARRLGLLPPARPGRAG